MNVYDVSKRFGFAGPLSDKAVQVCRMFGLTTEQLDDRSPTHRCRLRIEPGDIVYLTGPSGSGKTVLLGELEQAIPSSERINLSRIRLPRDRTVIDCFADEVVTSLKTLSLVGLSEVYNILNRPCHLSAGQKYRFRLARALAAQKRFVFADEFCSELDRITAATVAFNIHKFAKQTNTTFILASSHEDILMDLAPDALVIKDFTGPAEVIYQRNQNARCKTQT